MEWTSKMEGGGSLYLRDEGNYLYLEATRPEEGEGLYKVILQGLQGRQVLGTMSPCEHGLKLSRMVSRSTMGQWGCLPLTKVICQMSFPFGEESNASVQPKSMEVPDVFLGEQGVSPLSIVEENWEKPMEAKDSKVEVSESRQGSGSPSISEEFFPVEEEIHSEEQWELVEIAVEEQTTGFRPCTEPEAYLTDPLLLRSIRERSGVLLSEEEGGFSLAVPYTLKDKFPMIPLFCFGQYTQLQGGDYLLFSFRQGAVPYVPDMA